MLICTFPVVTRTSNSGLTSFHISLVALQEHVLVTVPVSARQHSDLDIIHSLCGTLDNSRNSLKLRSQALALLPKQSKYYISDSHVLLSLHMRLPPWLWSSLAIEERHSLMYSSAQTAAASPGPSLQWDRHKLKISSDSQYLNTFKSPSGAQMSILYFRHLSALLDLTTNIYWFQWHLNAGVLSKIPFIFYLYF